jgi:serine/threonine protein kinase
MIANKYKVVSKIGEGKFGKVYKGLHEKTGESVAIKFECMPVSLTSSTSTSLKMLKHETAILHYLCQQHCRNIPLVYWYGIYNGFPALVMPFYSCSLQHYIDQEQNILPKRVIHEIAVSIIGILEGIHYAFVVHRDIKPDNFMISRTNGAMKMTLIDFGLASVFVDEHKRHVCMKPERNCDIIGTPKFISIHVHDGIQPSRRDDLISVGYILWMMQESGMQWTSEQNALGVQDGLEPANPFYEEIHIRHPVNRGIRNAKQIFLDNVVRKPENNCPIMYYLKTVYDLGYSDVPDYKMLYAMFTGIE